MDIAGIVAEGRQLQRAQRLDEALACFTKALALEPDHLEALGNRGSVLGALRRYDEALRDYDRALALSPNHAMLLYNRGSALLLSGRPAEAVESFDQALALNLDAAEIWNNRGNALRELNRALDAIASYDRAIAIRPDYAKAFYNRGNAHWVDLKQIEPALENFERAFAIDPECDNLRGDLLHLRMHVGDWQGFEAQKSLINAGVRAGRRVVGPFAYQAIAESPADLQACSVLYAAGRYPARTARGAAKVHPKEKIRVGYLCGEFRKQATSFLTAGLYEQHDRGKFHVIAYDNGWSDDSPLRHRLEKAFDAFTDISALSDREAAEKIASDEIDILVNLNGYFGGHRMGVFASRAAPVQVNYLGFPATLGAPYIDYILADKIVIPEQEGKFYSEQVVYLPVSYQVNDSKRAMPPAPRRADHGLPNDAFVFCNFNQSYKLTPDIFAAWMRILKQVPGSLLWLLQGNPTFPENIRAQAQSAGVAPERVVFAPMIDAEDHLARIQLADLFLDTAPYNAHTTGSDALWAGIPLITVRGATFPGRVAESLLTAAGLPELITADMAAYEELAMTLAREPARLRPLRQKLQTRSVLFDTARLALGIEAAFTRMAELSRAGQPAQGFCVEN